MDLEYFDVFFIISIMLIFLTVIVLFLRYYLYVGEYSDKTTKIEDKVVIITGANSGIGKETAIDLARRGGKIYIACRDVNRAQNALVDIKNKSGSSNVHFLTLDLASMTSIQEFSKEFHRLESRLDILVNNAGVMGCPKSYTSDGFEMHMGVNHLGHFLLTNLLLDLLKEAPQGRIINVSSLFHIVGKIAKTNFFGERFYFRWLAYGTSKLANILFTQELARRLESTNITVNSLHPGVVRSELLRYQNVIFRILIAPFVWMIFQETIAGAQTQICLAVDPSLAKVTGKYFSNCKETSPKFTFTSRADETGKWLWNKSEELTFARIREIVVTE